MRKPKTVARAIQRGCSKVQGLPKKAKNYDDLVEIPKALSETIEKTPFLFYNKTAVDNDASRHPRRILLFMSETGRQVIN